MIERLYNRAIIDGADKDIVRIGFKKYGISCINEEGQASNIQKDNQMPESVKLFDRVLSLAGQPSLGSIVRQEHYVLIEELFERCPEMLGTCHDHPSGKTVYENLCNAASWRGYPKVIDIGMRICPRLHTLEISISNVHSALISHNRDGEVEDYHN